jgi:hypothetical protein
MRSIADDSMDLASVGRPNFEDRLDRVAHRGLVGDNVGFDDLLRTGEDVSHGIDRLPSNTRDVPAGWVQPDCGDHVHGFSWRRVNSVQTGTRLAPARLKKRKG